MNTILKNFFDGLLSMGRKTKATEVSQTILSSIAQTATDAILIADADSTIVFCNKKATQIFGYSQQELINSNLSLLMPAQYREAHQRGMDRFVATGVGRLIGHTIEVEGLRKGGVSFPMELSLSFWQQEGIFFTAIIRDVTKRKQIEQELVDKNTELQQANEELLRTQEALQETNYEMEKRVKERTTALAASEKELRLITDALPVLISYIDKDETYRFVSQAYEQWFKLERRALVGKTLREIAGEEAYGAIKENIRQALAGHAQSFERLMHYQRVESRYVDFRFIPRWEDKQVVGFYLLATDISERKKAEKEAKQASERLTLLLESIPQLTWTSPGEESAINFFNKQWYAYTGLTQEQSLGMGWQQALHPDDLALVIARRTSGRREAMPYRAENRYRHRDGSFRWHLTQVVPIKDENNHLLLWVGTATDIHELKTVQQELQTTTQELAAANEELSSASEELLAGNEELSEANKAVLESNQKLAASNEQLTKINTDLDNFIYTASHDLKAPIANIEGLTLALVKKLTSTFALDEEQSRILSMIAASVDRLKATIGSLTQIAKAQKGEEEAETVSIQKLIGEVELDLAKLLAAGPVLIDTDIEIDEFRFAKKNLQSILYNLLSNAAKYASAERTPQIKIITQKQADYLLIRVKDNGIGISENNLQKLFTMFKRFHTHVEGTGIGLYIVKRIVENAGGKIEVESTLNIGTTFTIYLPFKK
ncbi:PAS domain S-box protein [Rhodocytophaga aerolata]|uniref:histidine kinase n=1 Tax=Rhodocytophaga aerolata TaxID=455078 RepID=A0ABT8RK59_9BACT|nr:PAS domain S-box protein [Rhodocytophaga aerolata]MDO1451718.1 PAS domain S-box protein [Rhodocytophaga aerolata]